MVDFKKIINKVKNKLAKNLETKTKEEAIANDEVPVWWDIEKKLKENGEITDKQAISFFCPVYFAGQVMVEKLLEVKDERGDTLVFPLPAITDPDRVKFGLDQMERLGIKNPKQYLKKNKKNDKMGLPLYSTLPGLEGIGSESKYDYIGWEAVMLAAFQIVPKRWLNAGDPYNESYKFPGEKGYSPYWRVPPYEEFKKMRPGLADNFIKEKDGFTRKK